MSTLSGNTWRRKGSLASWDFQVLGVPETEGELPRWYASTLLRVLGLLDGFAWPAEVRLTTASGGEDAWVVDMAEERGADRLAEILATVDDLEDVEISLTLLCRESSGSAGATGEIPDGATIWLTLEQDADDRASPLRLLFSLHVDIYAARTLGHERDNARLASLNAPRLEGFLTRLEALPAEFVDIDAPSYSDQVHAHGFRA